MKKIKKFIKDKWEWIVGGIVAILAIISMKKSKSKEKIEKKDLEIELKTEKTIQAEQEVIRKNSEIKKEEILKDHEDGTILIQKEEKKRVLELKDDPEAMQKYLAGIGLNKK